jgi:hypothetical protein
MGFLVHTEILRKIFSDWELRSAVLFISEYLVEFDAAKHRCVNNLTADKPQKLMFLQCSDLLH